jgi:hypothetical protein
MVNLKGENQLNLLIFVVEEHFQVHVPTSGAEKRGIDRLYVQIALKLYIIFAIAVQ